MPAGLKRSELAVAPIEKLLGANKVKLSDVRSRALSEASATPGSLPTPALSEVLSPTGTNSPLYPVATTPLGEPSMPATPLSVPDAASHADTPPSPRSSATLVAPVHADLDDASAVVNWLSKLVPSTDTELFNMAQQPSFPGTESPHTAEEMALKDAAESGLYLHAPLGQQFQRAVRSAKAAGDSSFDGYRGTTMEKAAWRQRWCQDRYTHIVHRRTSVEAFSHLDFKKTTCNNVDQLLQEQGGAQSAAVVAGVATQIQKC